jgi:polyketide cyclase/dehydrase/lipid transport protein
VLKIIAIIVVLAVVVVLVLASRKPDHFRVQRSASINAPPERIFPLINDFHRWGAWSPYEHKDPDMKRTFSGTGSGQGAIYEWAGNSNIGSGRMEIVESSAPSKVAIRLDFLKPFEAHNLATFTMVPAGGASNVTWIMDGRTPFVGKIMHVFINMDRMVGTDFEAGLANLKTAAEREPARSAS